jgi:hypothetical protein
MEPATPVTTPARKVVPKPDKPWPEFPLYWHPRGYWMCKRRGKELRYTADALTSYDEYKADLEAERSGIGRPVTRKRYFLRDAVNLYLTRQKKRMNDGDLSEVQFAKCRTELERKLAIPLTTPLDEFNAGYPGDPTPARLFAKITEKAVARGLQAAHRHITIVRAMLDHAAGKHLMRAPDYGDDFNPPSSARIDRHRNDLDLKYGARSWTVIELRKMLAVARERKQHPHLYAQMLLALFAGFGSDDCCAVTRQAFKREKDVVVFPRVKNGRPRVAFLPKRVWDALDDSAKCRDKIFKANGVKPGHAEAHLFFLTDAGRRCNEANPKFDDRGLVSAGRNDTIGKKLQRLAARLELSRYRAGFKTLRAMSRTFMLGGGVDGDLIAVVMGRRFRYPVDEYYIRGELREKLEELAKHIERQLFGRAKRIPQHQPKRRVAGDGEPVARRRPR